jgi:hypothetical protein
VTEPADVALVLDELGRLTVHAADCQTVRTMAAMGEPVCTMFGCQEPIPPEYPRHTCLTGG